MLKLNGDVRIPRDTMGDVETFPNFFCCVLKHADVPHMGVFEISARRNDAWALVEMLQKLERLCGYNIVGFDYPVLHYLINAVRSGEAAAISGQMLAARLYDLAQRIIAARDSEEKFAFLVWERDRYVPLLDLMLVHNMDNKARRTSLKALQFALRLPSIVECPVAFGTVLTPAQMDMVIDYCCYDVWSTGEFHKRSKGEIEFRAQLGPEFTNLGETKLGKKILADALEAASPGCTKLQTIRTSIALNDIIFPYVHFQSDALKLVLANYRAKVIDANAIKGSFEAKTHFAGITWKFGVGGLHASVRKLIFRANDEYEITDIDVTSFYPRMAIVNRMRPQHLGDTFSVAYNDLFEERQTWPKGTPQNVALKYGLNGVFGDTGNEFSKFRDAAFMLATTINGQLLAAVLAEALAVVPGATIIQANTDGVTVFAPRRQRERIAEIIAWWMHGTGLQLEHNTYDLMCCRDVNNYVARDLKGKSKRKGAYDYDLSWWQDPSMLAVPRAAEAHFIHGRAPAEYLDERATVDPWDFLMRERGDKRMRYTWAGAPIQNTVRFYAATDGAPLYKHMKKKSTAPKVDPTLAMLEGREPFPEEPPPEWSTSERAGGHLVRIANNFDGRRPADLDLRFYAAEVDKLVRLKEFQPV